MARRDVDLVITARDQAKGAITAITKAIEQFVETQKGVPRAADRTDDALRGLGASLSKLKTQFGAEGLTGKIASELQQAKGAVQRLSQGVDKATGEAIGYTRESRRAAESTDVLRAESERVANALTKQKLRLAEVVQGQKALSGTVRQAENEVSRLANRSDTLSGRIETKRKVLRGAQDGYKSLQAAISETSGSTAGLNRQLKSASESARRAGAGIATLRAEQRGLRASIDAASQAAESARRVQERQNEAVATQARRLESLKNKYQEIKGSLSAAEKGQTGLGRRARKATGSLTSQNTALGQADAAYQELKTAAAGAAAALRKLEDEVKGPLLKAFGQQKTVVESLRREFDRMSTEAQRAGRALARTNAPTEEMVANFRQARSAAAQARGAFRLQQEELGNLRRVLRESGGDVAQFADRQQRAQAIVTRADAAYRGYTASVTGAASATGRATNATRQASTAHAQLSRAQSRTAATSFQAAKGQYTLADAMQQFYGDSRRALSYTQRLRGELLSLLAAYGGFFAVVQGLRGVIDAYQQLEGAQSRLNAVFDGDQKAIGREMDYIRRNAERLGVQFGILANEYTKFVVATKDTPLEGDETQRIFISVTEAARVNKASNDQLKGVFVALTQIVNKGVVSMEELRQQLGDRLPGAIQIMANAAGVGTDELIKLIERGELSATVLSNFADELDSRFGAALPKALRTTTAEIGRFQNQVFQSSLVLAQGGFIESFTKMLKDVSETLRSDQFVSFLGNVSVAAGGLADVVGTLATQFDVIVIVISAFLGKKIAPFIFVLTKRLLTASVGFRGLTAATTASTIGMNRFKTAVVGVTSGVKRLSLAVRSLDVVTKTNLVVTAITAGIGYWATRTDEATEALSTHRDLVDKVRNAYDKAGGSVEEWGNKVGQVTATQARANLKAVQSQLDQAKEEFEQAIPRRRGFWIFTPQKDIPVSSEFGDFLPDVKALSDRFVEGEIAAEQFHSQLVKITEEYRKMFLGNEDFEEIANEIDKQAGKLSEMSATVNEAELVVKSLTSSSKEAEGALRTLGGGSEAAARGASEAADKTEEWRKSLEGLKRLIPSLSVKVKFDADLSKLEEAKKKALKLAGEDTDKRRQTENLFDRARSVLESRQSLQVFDGAARGSIGEAAALVRSRQGTQSQGGPETSTVTLSDGTVQEITDRTARVQIDANRDLLRRLEDAQSVARSQIGEERFAGFSSKQQAVLTSIVYEYGDLPKEILSAIREGTTEEIAKAIRGTGASGIAGLESGLARVTRAGAGTTEALERNARRNQNALIFQGSEDASGAADQALLNQAERRADAQREIAERKQQAREATEETIAAGQYAIEQQELIAQGEERKARIIDAVRDARRENADITQEQVQLIREQAALLYDLEQSTKGGSTAEEKARQAESRVNDLLTLRKQLEVELALHTTQGAGAEVMNGLYDQMQDVNEQIEDAIDNALKLLDSLGSSDPVILTMISRLRELKVQSGEVSQEWDQIEKTLASSLVNAADRFAQALHEGKSVVQSIGEAFRQFAVDFLRKTAEMIVQQLALNAAKGITGFFQAQVAHAGGIAGSPNVTRTVDVDRVVRYHSGGIAGLRPNEVPAILERGEEVLTREDPRHIFNRGRGEKTEKSSGQGGVRLKVVNAIDAGDMLSNGLDTRSGEEAIMNFIGNNAGTINATLGR